MIEDIERDLKKAEEIVAQKKAEKFIAKQKLERFINGGIITKEERLKREAEERERLLLGSIKTISQVEQETKEAFKKAESLEAIQGKKLKLKALSEEVKVKKKELLKLHEEEMMILSSFAVKKLEIRKMSSQIRREESKEETIKLKEKHNRLKEEELDIEIKYEDCHKAYVALNEDIKNLEKKITSI